MSDQRRRLLSFLGLVVFIVFGYALLYDYSMSAFEGQPRSFMHSLGIVIETFTTTGYGEDAAVWNSIQVQTLMIFMQLTGVSIIFLTLPLFIAPWFEERLSATVPSTVDDIEDHIVVCELSARGEALIDELETWDREYVIIESDRSQAADLNDDGYRVIHGDPEEIDTLEGGAVEQADTVVVDAPDEESASIILSLRELDSSVPVIAFAENPRLSRYLDYAGADEVFLPHELLGQSLAEKVTTAVTMEVGDTVEIGTDFELAELPVQTNSELSDQTIAESGIRERTGANVIGLWRRGTFVAAPQPETEIDDDTILLVTGSETQLERLKELTLTAVRSHPRGNVIIAGYGEVGLAVDRAIGDDMETTIIDELDIEGTDVVGDATEEEVLRQAGIGEATAIILAMGDDTAIMFATLVARQLDDDIQIVARSEEAENISKIYRAGADYVLSLSTVSGRMIASAVLNEEVMSPETQIEIVRTNAPELVGQSLAGADIRSRTGCTVVAVERNGQVITDLDPEFLIEPDDRLILAGADEGINQFNTIAH
ncbi:MAG: TrkA family potassium uptake protein [Halobacteriales archaeon]